MHRAADGLAARLDGLVGPPADADPGKARVGRLVATVAGSGLLGVATGALLVALTEASPSWGTTMALGSMFALCGLSLLLVRLGSQTAAARVLFHTGALGTTMLVLSGRTVGFSDIAMMLYPVLVIMAALFFRRLEALLCLAFILALLGGTLAVVLLGYVESPPGSQPLPDFGFAVVIVAVSGVASRLMAAEIERGEIATRSSQEALARANRELRSRAADREQLLSELATRNDELQRFTSTVSHELKSPLVTIGAFVGCVERDAKAGDTEKLLADLGWIRQAQETMSALLADLLTLSRVGRLQTAHETLPFGEVVEEARSRCAASLAERGARLRIADRLPLISGERRRLVQLMQHLLENACKFSGDSPSPVIEVGSRQLDGEIVLYVKDEGIGIDAEHHERLFDLFRQLHPGTPGTGVGLALVRKIVEAHGGRVWVVSEGAGLGSEFRFTLAYTQTPLD